MKDQNISNEKKLGRGLSALLGDGGKSKKPEVVVNNLGPNEIVQNLSMNKIMAGIYQPRLHFSSHELEELSNSIKEHGVIQPIIVRKANEADIYEIVAGERRYRASKMAGLTEIPAIVKDINNTSALEFAIIENVQRMDLTPIEEARGYKQLINEFFYTQEQIASKIGKSRSHIANLLRLLSLPKEVQDMIDKRKITMGHARAIINHENVVELAHKIVEESLSVRDIEDLIGSKTHKNHSGKKAINSKDLKTRELKSQYLRTVEKNLSETLKMKVKATFDNKEQKGKLTIFYNGLEDVEKLIKRLEK